MIGDSLELSGGVITYVEITKTGFEGDQWCE